MLLREGLSLLLTVLYVSAAAARNVKGYDSSNLDAAVRHYETLHVDQLLHKPHPLPHVHDVSFHALGRDFNLHLHPDTRTLASNFRVVLVNHDGQKTAHREDTNNFLQGHLHDEDSHVTAHLSEDGILSAVIATPTATYHVEPSAHFVSGPHNFHMVIYEQSHIRPRLNATKMDYVYPQSHPHTLTKFHERPEVKESEVGGSSARLKRQSDERRGSIGGSFCGMVLVADHTVYNQFGRSVSSVSRQLVLIVSMVSNNIYKGTEWIVDSSGNTETGLGLSITEVIVHSVANTSENHYNTGRDNVDASELLSLMRLEPWQGNCLVHLFTNRNFASGLLGLANIASPLPRQTGGICSTRFRDSSGDLVIYNTGLSSFNNAGQVMVIPEMVRVVGHEIGHNWGSFHDPPEASECRSFLMNEFAQDGSNPTHSMFSICSSRAIGSVLLTKASCFGAEVTFRCGNYLKEDGEECDAGPDGAECCTSDCQLTTGSVCSDVNSPCCSGCQVADSSVVCRTAPAVTANCIGNTFCTGSGLSCPNTTTPAEEGSLCFGGTCQAVNGSMVTECRLLCSTFCSCDGTDECKVCCQEGEACVPAQNGSVNLATGSECSRGICVNGACSDRTQDNIQRIWEIITSLDSNALRLLIMENIVGVILIFTIPGWVVVGTLIHCFIDVPLLERFIKAYEGTDLGKWIRRGGTSGNNEKRSPEREPLMGIREESEESIERMEEHPEPLDPVDHTPIPRTLL